MNKILGLLLIALQVCVPTAALAQVTSGSYAPGLIAPTNFTKNPSCLINTRDITASANASVSKVTGSSALIGATACQSVFTAAAATTKFSIKLFDKGTRAGNCAVNFSYAGANASGAKVYVEQNFGAGLVKVGSELQLTNEATDGRAAYIPFPCGGSTVTATNFVVESTAAAATVQAGGIVVGVNEAIGVGYGDTPLVSAGTITLGATTTAPAKGVVTSDVIRWGRKGDMARIRGEYRQSSSTGASGGTGDYLISLPAGLQFDPAKVSYYTAVQGAGGGGSQVGLGSATLTDNGTSLGVGVVIPYDATRFRISTLYNAPGVAYSRGYFSSAYFSLSGGPIGFTFDFEAPIAGFGVGTAIRADQTNYDWTKWTPTTAGFTISTNECFHKRDGRDLLYKCIFTIAGTSATTATIALPNGLLSDGGYMGTGMLSGNYARNVNGAETGYLVANPGSNLLNITLQYVSGHGLGGLNGSSAFTAGNVVSLTGRTSIVGWTENMKAPPLINGVLSSSQGTERVERFHFTGGGGLGTNCAVNTSCTVTHNSAPIVSSNMSAGAILTVVLATPFGGKPECTCSAVTNGSAYRSCYGSGLANGSFEVSARDGSGTPYAAEIGVICVGPR